MSKLQQLHDEQRQMALRRSRSVAVVLWLLGFVGLAAVLVVTVAYLATPFSPLRRLGAGCCSADDWFVTGLLIAGAVLCTALLVVGWQMAPARPRQRSRTCMQCGYDLRASGSTCPECGWTFTATPPRAWRRHPRWRLIAAACAVAAAAWTLVTLGVSSREAPLRFAHGQIEWNIHADRTELIIVTEGDAAWFREHITDDAWGYWYWRRDDKIAILETNSTRGSTMQGERIYFMLRSWWWIIVLLQPGLWLLAADARARGRARRWARDARWTDRGADLSDDYSEGSAPSSASQNG